MGGVCSSYYVKQHFFRARPNPKLCRQQWNAATLIGLPVKEAADIAERHGTILRVVKIDGVGQPITLDESSFRVDVDLVDDRVRAVHAY